MSIKNQNYAHEKVWHMTFFPQVTLLFEFIDQKFKLFKSWGVSWPPSCISAHVYNYISNGFFFSSSRPKETKVDQAVLMAHWRIWQKSHSVSV